MVEYNKINLELLYFLKFRTEGPEEHSRLEVLKFCMDLGLIASEYECPKCKCSMTLGPRDGVIDRYEWSCRTYSGFRHSVKRCVRKGTWFENSKLSLCDILIMTEFFIMNRTQSDVTTEMKLSEHTVCQWRNLFRDVCLALVLNWSLPIGGVNKTVEFGHCDFRKRQLNGVSDRLEGDCLVGGLEKGSNRCFLRVVRNNDVDTLLEVVKDLILPGSTVYTNSWESLSRLNHEGFHELTVNRSITFRSYGDHKKTKNTRILGVWSFVKRQIPSRIAKDHFDSYLGEYLWRKSHSQSDDLMREFLEGVATMYKPLTRDPDPHPGAPSLASE